MDIYINSLFKKIDFRKSQLFSLRHLLQNNKSYLDDLIKEYILPYTVNDIYVNINNISLKKEEKYDFQLIDKKKFKHIYNQLILKTHPDKTCENEDFIIIKQAYDTNDYYNLIKFSYKYELEQDIDEGDLLLILEKTLFNLKKQIKNLKSSPEYEILVSGKSQMLDAIIKLKEQNDELKKRIKQQDENLEIIKKFCKKEDIYT